MATPTVAAGIVRGLLEFAVFRGGNADALAAAARIGADALADPDARIPFASYKALMRAAKSATRDPALALRWGADVDMAEVSVVGLIMNAAETMADAFAQMQRYGRLVLETGAPAQRFDLAVRADGPWLVDGFADALDFPEMIEVTFARLVCGPRRFLKEPHVREIHVTYPAPLHRAAYDEIFGCPVRFDSNWNAIGIYPDTPSRRVSLQPHYAFGVLAERADALLARLDASAAFRGKLEGILLPALHTGEVNADWAAARLGMSRQTLYRRLKAEELTFGDVLDGLRRRMALDYLAAKRVSVNETAYLVGFSDPAAFSRAFKRWTGMSPGAARKQPSDRGTPVS